MEADWTLLAEQRVYARPETDEDARDALEWIAAQEGKTLAELVDEIEAPSAAVGLVGAASEDLAGRETTPATVQTKQRES